MSSNCIDNTQKSAGSVSVSLIRLSTWTAFARITALVSSLSISNSIGCVAFAGFNCHKALIAADRTVSRRSLSIEMAINLRIVSSEETFILPRASAACVTVVSSSSSAAVRAVTAALSGPRARMLPSAFAATALTSLFTSPISRSINGCIARRSPIELSAFADSNCTWNSPA